MNLFDIFKKKKEEPEYVPPERKEALFPIIITDLHGNKYEEEVIYRYYDQYGDSLLDDFKEELAARRDFVGCLELESGSKYNDNHIFKVEIKK